MSGPFLYDDDPAPLHTGTPRSMQGWIVGGIVGIALFAAAMVGFLYLVKGSPAEQSTQSAEVFVASLSDGDIETAHQMLCEEERARLTPDQVAGEYLGAVPGEVGEVRDDEVEGAAVQLVSVSWADGVTTELRVVSEDGPRVCGVFAGN
ncbi:hypothetical protein GCU60_13150 [Blastococcus saxobsidens]|uniref:DUF4878 domain-containing protein n=1 Tax=Blastococcus saxobsidens TaxID=138336 RepID=A0A6L9W3W7_9ACTN|nr:hypothetical protein [Blastococcus saxobsidens]NEK86693.1 hypothetical protein [Blastococcus saxobsidens]